MRVSSILASVTLLWTSVSAISFEDDMLALNEDVANITARQNGFYAITGAAGPNAMKPRYEVRDMQANKPRHWNLFLATFRRYHDLPQSEKDSYYQIAGIHGVPRQNWDNVGQCSTCSGTDGYCPHGSILFLGWHRVYMALFEQRFVELAKQVAQEYPTANGKRRDMVYAANEIRFPFWDWAAHPPNGGNNMPDSFTTRLIEADTPDGRKRILNPLFRHDFDDPSDMVYSPYTHWGVSYRYPNSDAVGAVSQTNKAVAALNNVRQSMQDQLYNMFSTCDEFIEVASDQQGQSSSRCSSSLEGIHNTIHNVVGGTGSAGVSGGHMPYLALSAFDPVFFLHHMNVDRLFALWQGIYPNSYRGKQTAPGKTWTVAAGSLQDLHSPLMPFHKNTAGDFYNTLDVRSWWQFGYTYPEYLNSDGSTAAIKSIVNKLYGSSATAPAGTSSKRAVAAGNDTNPIEESVTNALANITPLKADNGSFFQYVANVKTPRFALDGSYYVYLFNGEPAADDPGSYLTASNLIGPIGVLAQKGMVMEGNDWLASYSIPLTRTLLGEWDNGIIANMAQAAVTPFLTEKLVWRIVNSDGELMHPGDVEGFEVVVYYSTATPPTEGMLPEWSDFNALVDVTEAKAGGATAASLNLPQIVNGTLGALNDTAGAVGADLGLDSYN